MLHLHFLTLLMPLDATLIFKFQGEGCVLIREMEAFKSQSHISGRDYGMIPACSLIEITMLVKQVSKIRPNLATKYIFIFSKFLC